MLIMPGIVKLVETISFMRHSDFHGSEATWLAAVKTQVESLRFGTVQIIVHDAQVVQIEKTEKVRFQKPDGEASNQRDSSKQS
jgi:hypothetical protein